MFNGRFHVEHPAVPWVHIRFMTTCGRNWTSAGVICCLLSSSTRRTKGFTFICTMNIHRRPTKHRPSLRSSCWRWFCVFRGSWLQNAQLWGGFIALIMNLLRLTDRYLIDSTGSINWIHPNVSLLLFLFYETCAATGFPAAVLLGISPIGNKGTSYLYHKSHI